MQISFMLYSKTVTAYRSAGHWHFIAMGSESHQGLSWSSLLSFVVVCSSCACIMRPRPQGTKPYQAHYLIVCCVLHAHVQFCRFDRVDATADIQWHCSHQTPLLIPLFPAQSTLVVDILVCWIGKIVWTCAVGGSWTLDLLREQLVCPAYVL